MTFKKLLISFLFGLSLCSFSSVYAGNVDDFSDDTPEAEAIDYSGVYVDLAAGYAGVKWSGATIGVLNGFSTAITGGPTSNGDGSFSYGVDVGYQINRYLGFEFAWYYLPKVMGTSDVAAALPDVTIKTWVAYAALKVMVPIWGKLDVFAKIGPSYRYLRYSGQGSSNAGFGGQSDQYWKVMYAAGFQYWLNQNWVISLQYLQFPKYARGDTANRTTPRVNRQAPTAHIYVATVGYKFSL